jgi:hypothetical protein
MYRQGLTALNIVFTSIVFTTESLQKVNLFGFDVPHTRHVIARNEAIANFAWSPCLHAIASSLAMTYFYKLLCHSERSEESSSISKANYANPLCYWRRFFVALRMTKDFSSPLCHSERSEESIDRLTACRSADRCFVPQHDNSLLSVNIVILNGVKNLLR